MNRPVRHESGRDCKLLTPIYYGIGAVLSRSAWEHRKPLIVWMVVSNHEKVLIASAAGSDIDVIELKQVAGIRAVHRRTKSTRLLSPSSCREALYTWSYEVWTYSDMADQKYDWRIVDSVSFIRRCPLGPVWPMTQMRSSKSSDASGIHIYPRQLFQTLSSN